MREEHGADRRTGKLGDGDSQFAGLVPRRRARDSRDETAAFSLIRVGKAIQQRAGAEDRALRGLRRRGVIASSVPLTAVAVSYWTRRSIASHPLAMGVTMHAALLIATMRWMLMLYLPNH
jgi:hypothetical protein